MAGFHLPGDPYFLNEGNAGWLEAEPEEMIEEDLEEDPEEIDEEEEPEEEDEMEDEEEESEKEEEEEEPEEEVFSPPYIARVLVNRFGRNGPEPQQGRLPLAVHFFFARTFQWIRELGIRDKIASAINRYVTEVRRLNLPQSQIETVYIGFNKLEEYLLASFSFEGF
uniref:Uncharacterized protein n=1 Tax=Lactuca sativa TaxID=4236 RepID=A0A9R1UTG9_LACSA|nr:hypothetical protein LSAT_V11C800407240 [Lactuca sativa]